MEWIKIENDLPKNQKLVQIAYKGKYVTVGWYCRKFEVEADFDIDDDYDYDEERDEYFIKEGWRSQCLESEWYYTISDVTDWAPLLTHPLKQ